MYGVFMASLDDNYGYLKHLKIPVEDRRQYGISLVKAYNKWGMKVASISPRIRPALPVFGETVDELFQMARELVAAGIRAVWLPTNWLPGGKSPAHPALDPFWELMVANKVAVCLHVGAESKIYGTDEWSNAPAFQGFRLFAEFKIDPWSRTNAHVTAQNFVSTMVLGGVFDRHPNLYLGVIELGAYWVGPMCDTMDIWYKNLATHQKGTEPCYRLPKKPSDYIRSNVRVSCYDFEEVDVYITRHNLEDVLCFASDYPHEGGKNPAGAWLNRLKPLGKEIVEKFFVTNAKLLLPEAARA